MKKLCNIIILLMIFLITSCAAFFQPRVPMLGDSNGSTLKDLLIRKEEPGQLSTPYQVMVSKNASPNEIDITWSSVPNAVSYRIEFAIVEPGKDGKFPDFIPEEKFTVIKQSLYQTTFKHEITESIINNYDAKYNYEDRYKLRYYYRIIATNTREGYGESIPSPANIYGTLFAYPLNVNASAGINENYIEITWDYVDGATSYEIYRSESLQDPKPLQVKKANGKPIYGNENSFKDFITAPSDKGKEFYYTVYALNNKTRSNESAHALGFSLVPGAPTQPQNVKIIDGRGEYPNKISIKWDAVSDLKYNVFRKSSKDATILKVKKDLTKGEFTDTKNLEPGVYYTYLIQSYLTQEENGVVTTLKSTFSSPVEGYILSAPSNLKARKNDGKIHLSWTPAIGSESEQSNYIYKIYTSNDKLDGYQEHWTTNKGEVEVDVGIYSFYKIQTMHPNGNVSDYSELVSPTPDPVTDVNVTKAEYTSLEELGANPGGVYPVRISWKKPEKDNPYGYYVYRSQKPDSGFRKISEHIIKDTLEFVDADSTLQASKVYYYKVLSLNTLEQGDNPSQVSYGWGALTQERYLIEFNKTIISSQKKLTLMHKPGSTQKLGSESKKGDISGTVSYNAQVVGLGAEITMHYDNYADFYIDPNNKDLGILFTLNGNSDTSANMKSNGTMKGTIVCTGMYPGKVSYDKIEINAGAAGGGTYGVSPEGTTSKDVYYDIIEGN